MPIINLTLQGKQATGDGTVIVCMNSDYVVRLTATDCAEFLALPVKKLVAKWGTEYQESTFDSVTAEGQTVLQATLPPVRNGKSVELGVCGKTSENALPTFSSKPVVFNCTKSIMNGAIVPIADPELKSLYADKNGTYKAVDKDADGFHEVTVNVPPTPSEARTIPLSMAGGQQVIIPSAEGKVMSQVTITKPATLIPGNILKDVDIGGVVGTFALEELVITEDGEYLPPEGFGGFSKVTSRVLVANHSQMLLLGNSFQFDYDFSAKVTIDMPGVVKYEDDGSKLIFTAIGRGNCSVLIQNMNAEGKVIENLRYAIMVNAESDYLLPREVDDASLMSSHLYEDAVGAVLKYTGHTTDTFIRDCLYIVTKDEGVTS